MTMQKKQTTSKPHSPLGYAGSWATDFDPSALAERLLTVGEAARMLHVCRSTVYNLVRCGDLPGIRLRRVLRLRLEDVRRHLQRLAWRARRIKRARGTVGK